MLVASRRDQPRGGHSLDQLEHRAFRIRHLVRQLPRDASLSADLARPRFRRRHIRHLMPRAVPLSVRLLFGFVAGEAQNSIVKRSRRVGRRFTAGHAYRRSGVAAFLIGGGGPAHLSLSIHYLSPGSD